MSKQKLRWFRFFYIYKEAFIELSARNCKKLILMMCNYAESGIEPKRGNKKLLECFNSFKMFYDADIEMYKIYGAKGGKKASNKAGYSQGKSKNNRG